MAVAARRRRGLTLIEAAMVLGILSLVVAAVVAGAGAVYKAQRDQSALDDAVTIMNTARSVYASELDFRGIGPESYPRILPPRLQGASGWVSPLGSPISMLPWTSGSVVNAMILTFSRVQASTCRTFASARYDRRVVALVLGAAVFRLDQPSGLDRQGIETACERGSGRDFSWVTY